MTGCGFSSPKKVVRSNLKAQAILLSVCIHHPFFLGYWTHFWPMAHLPLGLSSLLIQWNGYWPIPIWIILTYIPLSMYIYTYIYIHMYIYIIYTYICIIYIYTLKIAAHDVDDHIILLHQWRFEVSTIDVVGFWPMTWAWGVLVAHVHRPLLKRWSRCVKKTTAVLVRKFSWQFSIDWSELGYPKHQWFPSIFPISINISGYFWVHSCIVLLLTTPGSASSYPDLQKYIAAILFVVVLHPYQKGWN